MADEFNAHDIGESIHGGGRFNHWLLVAGIIVATVAGITLVHGLFARGTVSQVATKQLDDDDERQRRARVKQIPLKEQWQLRGWTPQPTTGG
ncbi:MAG TPA: hypothetical protein VKB84_14185 [Candidatus Binataceae bacterium]|nr:hypothetical protein [Candidatus Binataceae bacterium]